MTFKTVAKRCSFSGVGFSIKTIIPDTREHLFTPTNLLNTYPFGGFGFKQSGIGRELGYHGLDDFLEVKQIFTDGTGLAAKPAYGQLIKEG